MSDYPGGRAYRGSRWYGSEPLRLADEALDIDDTHLTIELLPHSRIHLELGLRRNVGGPRLGSAPYPA